MNQLTRRGERAHISPTCLRQLSGPQTQLVKLRRWRHHPMFLARPVRTKFSPDHQIIIVIIPKRKLFLIFVSEKEKSSPRKIPSNRFPRIGIGWGLTFDPWAVGTLMERTKSGAAGAWRSRASKGSQTRRKRQNSERKPWQNHAAGRVSLPDWPAELVPLLPRLPRLSLLSLPLYLFMTHVSD